MKIKVLCECGAKFEFEIEPVNGRMPIAINCPACGRDDTEAANQIIAHQLAPATAIAPSAGLKIRGSAPAPVASASSAPPVVEVGKISCAKHPGILSVQTCQACGKPMCQECVDHFGPVCSAYCKQKLEDVGVRVSAQRKVTREDKLESHIKYAFYAVALLVFLAITGSLYYKFFARNPKVVFTQALTTNDNSYSVSYSLAGPGQLLTVSNGVVALLQMPENKIKWSTTLSDTEIEKVEGTGSNLWFASEHSVFHLNPETGAELELSNKGPFRQVIPNEFGIVMFGTDDHGNKTIFKVDTTTGEIKSESLEVAAAAPAVKKPATNTVAKVASKVHARPATLQPLNEDEAMAAEPSARDQFADTVRRNNRGMVDSAVFKEMFGRSQNPVIDTGANVVKFQTKLIEQRFEERTTMKKKSDKSVLDSGNVTASQGMDLAAEMANDQRRDATGGVAQDDVSVYQVTLHRFFAAGVTDAVETVTGPPSFRALQTVDLVSDTKGIHVFNKQNKKIWEAKLAYPMQEDGFTGEPLALEENGALFITDQGTITKFDATSGEVKWRFNTAKTEHMLFDPLMGFYINSTTGDADSIKYSDQVSLKKKIHTQMIRLDPDTGRALWQKEAAGDQMFISGNYLYAQRVNLVTIALELENGPQAHYYSELLDAKTGEPIWTYHRSLESYARMEVAGKWVFMRFPGRVVVLNFFSF